MLHTNQFLKITKYICESDFTESLKSGKLEADVLFGMVGELSGYPADFERYWIMGTKVKNALDGIVSGIISGHKHSLAGYFTSMNRKPGEEGVDSLLLGFPVVSFPKNVIADNLLILVSVTEGVLADKSVRRIVPDQVGQKTDTQTSHEVGQFEVPDPLFAKSFEVHCVTAEESIARQINNQLALMPNFLAIAKIKITLDNEQAEINRVWDIEGSPHKLVVDFYDLDFDQAQLDARDTLTSNALSALVIRQLTSRGGTSRFIQCNDLEPGVVTINLNIGADSVAMRRVVWKFKSVKESKEFPG